MNETPDAPSIFAPLWKRKWLILAVAVLVAGGTYLYYKRQPQVFEATTQLFLGNGAEEQAQIGGAAAAKKSAPEPANQAALINTSLIREGVRRRLRAEHKQKKAAHQALHGKVKATGKEKTPFIIITAQAKSARAAALLANVTAAVYIDRQETNARRQVESAIALTRRQLRRIEASQEQPATPPPATSSGKGSSTTAAKSPAAKATSTATTLQTANLNSKINQLESQLSVTTVKQIETAKPARSVLVAPKPKENAIFGFAIGLVLASFIVYGLNRLDRRLRSLAEVEDVFHTQILTALPSVRHPVIRLDGRAAPSRPLREPIRRLHMALKTGTAAIAENGQELQPRVMLFVSADPGDGKSTLVANLALVQRDAGERVAVIEADFRRPLQGKLLDVRGPQGLAEVLEGRLPLEEAMQKVQPMHPAAGVSPAGAEPGGLATLVESSHPGSLSVLLGGSGVANPPALLARPAMSELLRSLAEDFDYILIDAPVPLQVSDVMPLLRVVDGIVIVARVGHTNETSARRLVQLLARTPSAPVLGAVANAVPNAEIEKYGFSSMSNRPGWRRKLIGR